MTAAIARSIAYSRHHDQRDRRGALLIEHVDRVAALEVLTRTPGESYELYVLRIAHAEGRTGRVARASRSQTSRTIYRYPATTRFRAIPRTDGPAGRSPSRRSAAASARATCRHSWAPA